MAVYTVTPGDKISLDFILERVYLRRNGSTKVTADILMQNQGAGAITRLRIALPYALVDVQKLPARKLAAAKSVFPKFQNRQIRRVNVRSDEIPLIQGPRPNWFHRVFAQNGYASNWIYGRTLPHVTLEFGAKGTIQVRRSGQSDGCEVEIPGYVKRNWRVELPPEQQQNHWAWFLLAVNNAAIVDVVPRGYEEKEYFHKGERMWMRLEFDIPPEDRNRHSIFSTYCSPTIDYFQWFSSPKVVNNEILRNVQAFPINDLHVTDQIFEDLVKAQREIPAALPQSHETVPVHDWRIFLYREYGLSVENIDYRGPEPYRPNKLGDYMLPPEAYPPFSRLGWAPALIYRTFKKRLRRANCHEFWIGRDHNKTDDQGYSIGISSRITNDLLIWISFFLATIALVFTVGDMRGWFDGWIRIQR